MPDKIENDHVKTEPFLKSDAFIFCEGVRAPDIRLFNNAR